MQYTKIPQIVDNLVYRLSIKATADEYTTIHNELIALNTLTWFNLPYQLNKIMDIVKKYQVELVDGNLQDLLDEIGSVYWYNIFKKVSLLIETVELIESL